MSTKTDPTRAVLDEIAELKKQNAKGTEVLEGLLKQLAEPASKAGMTPAALLHAMTNGGQRDGVIGGNGNFMPMTGQKHRIGGEFGKFLGALAEYQGRGNTANPGLTKALFDPPEKGGFGITKAALAEGSGVTGGYTVPPQFSTTLLSMAVEESIFQPRASKMPMSTLTLTVPYLDIVSTGTTGQSPFLGGVVATWTSEAATRTESEPVFKQMELKAHELSFYTVASNNLLADNAVGLDSLLTQLFKGAIAWYTDYAYFNGDGVGKPTGVINHASTIAVNRQTASRFTLQDSASMLARLYYLNMRDSKVAWVIHPSVIPQLIQMSDYSGTTAGTGRLVWTPFNEGAKDPIPQSAGLQSIGTLHGHPVMISEKLPKLNTAGDVMLIDFSKYLLGERMDLQIDVSPHVRFLNNQMVWRVVWRGDGQPWMSGAVTLADGTYTVSPFIKLN